MILRVSLLHLVKLSYLLLSKFGSVSNILSLCFQCHEIIPRVPLIFFSWCHFLSDTFILFLTITVFAFVGRWACVQFLLLHILSLLNGGSVNIPTVSCFFSTSISCNLNLSSSVITMLFFAAPNSLLWSFIFVKCHMTLLPGD